MQPLVCKVGLEQISPLILTTSILQKSSFSIKLLTNYMGKTNPGVFNFSLFCSVYYIKTIQFGEKRFSIRDPFLYKNYFF